jgi:hypothetical protein
MAMEASEGIWNKKRQMIIHLQAGGGKPNRFLPFFSSSPLSFFD